MNTLVKNHENGNPHPCEYAGGKTQMQKKKNPRNTPKLTNKQKTPQVRLPKPQKHEKKTLNAPMKNCEYAHKKN